MYSVYTISAEITKEICKKFTLPCAEFFYVIK